MRNLAFLFGAILVVSIGSNSWADLTSGSLSTPILFDSSVYVAGTPTPYADRTPVADPPGGLTATAAWDQYGMRLDWSVTQVSAGMYEYHYYFGPGWYPPTNGSGGGGSGKGNPWVTNKSITAWDIQLGSGMTMADIIDPTWNVYRFNGNRIGSGTATSWTTYNTLTGEVLETGTADILAVGELLGETGNATDGYTLRQLFHGLRWFDPMDPNSPGNFVYPDDVNFDLTFMSTYAPGWGNFFANSTQTGSNNDYSDVVAYNPFGSNTVSVAGGLAPVPLPPSVLLFGSGLSGLFLFGRKRVLC